MKMRNYMKRKENLVDAQCLTADEIISKFSRKRKKLNILPLVLPVVVLCTVIPVVSALTSIRGTNSLEGESGGMLSMVTAPLAATSAKKDLISIPSGTVKANPFLPYREINKSNSVKDVPKFDLVEPPETVTEGSDAARVMDTVVSGILYDKYSPSAILNIEGNDYLVKKGDVINNYKILNIMQDSVTVMLGKNTYKAGIGEILTEGSINYNTVSNLNKKFGGEKR